MGGGGVGDCKHAVNIGQGSIEYHSNFSCGSIGPVVVS